LWQEIQTIHNIRLDLAWQLIQKSQYEETHKLNARLQHYWMTKQQEKNKKIQKIRLDHNRGTVIKVIYSNLDVEYFTIVT
jgi:hypothetical protein